jgi:RHS repeat-associated protein
MIFDKSGSLATTKRHDYLPFGEELSSVVGLRSSVPGYSADAVRQKFTDKERDNETGLDYFGARYHSSTQGRFVSVDPLVVAPHLSGALRRPQAWNGYSYAINSPLRYEDPTGLRWAQRKLAGGGTEYGWFTTDAAYDEATNCDSETYEGWTSVDFDESKPFSAVSSYSFDQFNNQYEFNLVQLNPNGTTASQYVSVDLTDVGMEALSQTVFGKSWLNGKMSVQTTIADWTGQLKGIPMGMSLFPGKPPTPGGISTSKFGQDVMKWGSGDGAARDRIATLTRKELEESGVTKAMAEHWRDFYREVARVTPQNPSAAGRADLMERAAELLSGSK